MAIEVGAARRRIIRRPRLTSILDESTARIGLLVAPAGYGKTTLAREWLGEPVRRAVWYRGGPASADVAALAVAIAELASQVVPEAGNRMRDRLRATGDPEEDVDVLAELFAEDVQEWPSDAWLALDDYQFAMDSAASERFVDFVTHATPIQLLITSRRRPSWATARRILYGEILEIDRRALAMNDAEAREMLGREDPSIDELIARTRGWPAVLGLAALTGVEAPDHQLPDALYDYFAEELLQAMTAGVQTGLCRLAAFQAITLDLAAEMLGRDAVVVVDEGLRIGALVRSESDLDLHPLLRDLLLARLKEEGESEVATFAERAVALLQSRRAWDEAFHVLRCLNVSRLLPDLIAVALCDLLRDGRVQTIGQWLEFAAISHLSAPMVDLAEAEVALRQGHHTRAEALALAAAGNLESQTLKADALIRAGQAAVLGSRDEQALSSFRQARSIATTEHARLEALVGECFAVLELGVADEAEAVFAELAALPETGVEMRVRRAMVDLLRAARLGGITTALESAAALLPLLGEVKEPLVMTSFRNAYGHLLVLNSRYEEALELSRRQLDLAHEYRLDFVIPHALLVDALALSGVREFGRALERVEAAEEYGRESGDVHIAMYAAALRARVAIERHDLETASRHASRRWERPGSPSMRGELLGYRSLTAACAGDFAESESLSSHARGLRAVGVEASALISCAEGIVVIRTDAKNGVAAATRAFEAIKSLGAFDCFVTAARGAPDLFAAVLAGGHADTLARIFSGSNDAKLARSAGLNVEGHRRGPIAKLTPRELEVARLIARGHSNRVIAGQLYISESTVKVHVRHILEKFGARSRADVAARISTVD